MKIITKTKDGRTRVQTKFTKPSRTFQEFKDECDVNNIISKYKKTGAWPTHNKKGSYADLIGITDYKDAMDMIIHANDAFAQLPSDLRARFNNTPEDFLTFLNDRNNRDEAIKLGLIPSVDTPTGSPPVSTPPPATAETKT